MQWNSLSLCQVYLEVDLRENIGVIKEKIRHVLKQPVEGQRLYLGAQLLDDSKVLEDYGVKHGDSLDVAFSKEGKDKRVICVQDYG